MSQKRLSMRKLKEVLRLHSLGLKQQPVAGSCSISQSTVHEYLKAARAAGIAWPVPEEWDQPRLEQALFSTPAAVSVRRKNPLPDFAAIRNELQTHRNVTLQLVWEEYRQSQPDGYAYSHFCEMYRAWLKKQDWVLRQDHSAGEKLFVDYAGDTIPIWNPENSEVAFRAAIFVAAMGASSYTFAEATESQELRCWIGSHLRAFDFLGGVPEILGDRGTVGQSESASVPQTGWQPRQFIRATRSSGTAKPSHGPLRVRHLAKDSRESGLSRGSGSTLL